MVITLAFVAGREVIIPHLQEELVRVDWIKDAKNPNEVRRYQRQDGEGNHIFIGEYRVFDRKMIKVHVTTYYPPGSDGRRATRQRIYASEGHWGRDERDGRDRWFLSDGTVTLYAPDGSPVGTTLRFREDGVRVLHPGENPNGPMEFVSDLSPVQVRPHSDEERYYSTAQLRQTLERTPDTGGLATRYYQRYSSPLNIFVLLLLGLPFALSGRGRNAFHSVAFGAVVCFAYVVVMIYCSRLGDDGTIPAWAAAWLPVIVFGPVGALLLDGVPT
jgi:lipopolysaccharide export LptBFGC system permease protein LptF